LARYRMLVVNHAVDIGGAERVLLRLLGSLDPELFSASLAVPGEGPLTSEAKSMGIPVHTGHPAPRLLEIRRRSLGRDRYAIALYPYDLSASVVRLARLVSSGGFDLVFTNSAKADVYGTLAARLAMRPSVIRLHDIVDADAFSRLNVWLLKTCARYLATVTLPVSRASEDRMASLGVPRSKLHTVYNGIDLAAESRPSDRAGVRTEFGIGENAPLAGLVGRLVDWKGPDYFIKAAALVSERVPDSRFMVVGDAVFGEKDYVDGLKKLAEDLGLAERLVFTGQRSDATRMMSALDVLVHASILPDPLPTVLIEAMSIGRPVVAADSGGVPEIVEDGVTGLLSPPRDTRSMAGAITELFEDPVRARAMGEAGLERAKRLFDIESTTRDMEKALLGALRGGRRVSR
jgi:glycosyltransferase involved in cell wall biosynthesis